MNQLVQKWNTFMTVEREASLRDVGLLIMRLSCGLMMAFGHGLGKMQKFFAGGEIQFADPIGIGVGPSLFLAGSAEFLAALAVAVGLLTRLATIPLIFTMGVAAFIVHAEDPFGRQEFPLLYMTAFATLLLAGPGRFSVDALLRKKASR